ncbi:MAG: hypothetical protein AAF439_03270 [Pseudomonadota bacterium]
MTISLPVFVYGVPRSGMTVFRIIPNGHPTLTNPGETDFLFGHIQRRTDAATDQPLWALRLSGRETFSLGWSENNQYTSA